MLYRFRGFGHVLGLAAELRGMPTSIPDNGAEHKSGPCPTPLS